MITGWGAHHIDSAHWGMDTEHTGPVEIWGTAEFPTKGLWDVHGPFKTEALYANGVKMIVSGEYPNGIKFEGTDGWIFVSRGNETVTASDPVSRLKDSQALAASDPKIITSVIGKDEIHLYDSKDHHGNWLECVKSRQRADRAGGGRAPRLLRLPAPSHGDEVEAEAAVGSGEGAVQERRCRQRLAVAPAAAAVRAGGVAAAAGPSGRLPPRVKGEGRRQKGEQAKGTLLAVGSYCSLAVLPSPFLTLLR